MGATGAAVPMTIPAAGINRNLGLRGRPIVNAYGGSIKKYPNGGRIGAVATVPTQSEQYYINQRKYGIGPKEMDLQQQAAVQAALAGYGAGQLVDRTGLSYVPGIAAAIMHEAGGEHGSEGYGIGPDYRVATPLTQVSMEHGLNKGIDKMVKGAAFLTIPQAECSYIRKSSCCW
jgi:hypothetical protein